MITDRGPMISTGIPKTYEYLVDRERLFLKKHHLFTLGLVYGVIHDIKSDKRPDFDMVYLNQIKESVTKDIIDFILSLLDDGRNENEIFDEMLAIADAGVLKLKEMYEERKDIPLAELIQESSLLWDDRLKELNIQ